MTSRRALVWLFAIAVFSAALRVVLVAEVHGPFIFQDELGYARLAQSLAQTGHLALFSKQGLSYSPLYSVVLAPIYALGASAPTAYHWIKIVNAILMTLAVFPIYGIARFVLSRRRSIMVAAIAALAPLMYYTGLAMSENLAYPLFLVAVWAMLIAVRTPSPKNDVLLLASILLASAARIQHIALFPAALTAILISAILSRESTGVLRSAWQSFKRHWLLIGSAAVIVVGAAVRSFASSGALPLAGRYSGVGTARTSPWRLLELAVQHLAGLDLAVGVIPFAGALIAAYAFFRYGYRRDSLVFASVAVGATTWVLLLVAFDAAVYSEPPSPDLPRIHERYFFYLVPLFLVALLAATRIPRAKASFYVYLGAAVVSALLPAVIPFAKDINNTIVADSFSLQIFGQAVGTKIVPIAHTSLSAVSFAGTLALLYVLVRHRTRAVIGLVVLVFVLMSSLERSRMLGAAAGSTKAGLPAHHDWVDRADPRGDVILVSGPGASRIGVWETAFNNLSVSRVYFTCKSAFGTEYGVERITADRKGRLRDPSGYVRAPFAVVPAAFAVQGRVLARNTNGGLVLVAPADGQLTVPPAKRAEVGCPA